MNNNSESYSVAFNGFTGHVYTGKNAERLMSVAAGPWFTFKKVDDLGGRVKAGQHGTDVYVFFDKEEKEKDETGEEDEKTKKGVKRLKLFHLSQTEGIDLAKIKEPETKEEKPAETKTEEPKKEVKTSDVKPGSLIEVVIKLIIAKCYTYFVGPAGCGKSHAIEKACEILGKNFFYANCVQTVYDLIGFVDASGKYVETAFYKAFVNGGVFLLDEMDASFEGALTVINNAVSNGVMVFPGVGMVKMHPDFVCFATGNTVGRGADEVYTGRRALDAASLNRFFVWECDYETAVQESMFGVEISDFLNEVRATYKALGIKEPISYRPGQMIQKLETTGMALPLIVNGAIFKGIDVDTRMQVKESLKHSKNKYTKALLECA